MKTPMDVVTLLAGRLERYWAHALVLEAVPGVELEVPTWPHAIPLGKPTGNELEAGFARFAELVYSWRRWAGEYKVPLREVVRRVNGTNQILVTHVEIDSVDTAARLVGGKWVHLVATGRARLTEIITRFPQAGKLPSLLRSVTVLSDLDFRILLTVSSWFREHQGSYEGRLTPRQVPIEGVHAKWLNRHQGLVRSLAGLDNLALLPPHPPRIHFTYLDPDHLAFGGRRHDSYSAGDTAELPYEPLVVLVSENKDTAICFPPVSGGVAIEGEGRGASTIASIGWVRTAPHLFYWGDMDQDGLEILNEFRAAGLNVRSLLMSITAYQQYQHLGTNEDVDGNPIGVHPPRPVDELHSEEMDLYQLLCSGALVVRVEQERIPLSVAHQTLCATLIDRRAAAYLARDINSK